MNIDERQNFTELLHRYFEFRKWFGAKRMTVTICGSMRYISDILREYARLSLEGHLVYLPVILGVGMDGDAIRITHLPKLSDDLKEHLQQLHFKKIRLSDFIFVVNPGGYIGEGTAEEIEYAKHCGIPVKYLENELQSSFEESQDELASANAVIMKYKEAHNHLVSIVSELKEELRQTRIRLDEVEEARDNWKTEAIRRQNELNNIEMRNLMREKPAQECCEHCSKIDCSGCTICPF